MLLKINIHPRPTPKIKRQIKNTTKKLMSSPGISESFWHILVIDLKTYIDILEEILAKIITIMK